MNQNLISNLEILKIYYYKVKDHFRSMAYEKAIKELRKLKFEITDISQVKKTKGIGKNILDKIKEYITTGNIKKVDEVKVLLNPDKSEKELAIEDFLHIWGVGIVKATQLWDKGFRSIEDIMKNPSTLNRQQLIGLKYYADLKQTIPRMNITVIQVVIRFILDKEFGKNTYDIVIAGSYRRGKKISNDVDILITSSIFNLKNIVDILQKWNIITDVLSMQKEKFMGVAHCPNGTDPYFRLDIEFLPRNEFAFGLLYFTGSKDFNKDMRWHAKKSGYILNQHGLKNVNTNVWSIADTEEDIFEILNLEYVKPKDRI